LQRRELPDLRGSLLEVIGNEGWRDRTVPVDCPDDHAGDGHRCGGAPCLVHANDIAALGWLARGPEATGRGPKSPGVGVTYDVHQYRGEIASTLARDGFKKRCDRFQDGGPLMLAPTQPTDENVEGGMCFGRHRAVERLFSSPASRRSRATTARARRILGAASTAARASGDVS
jgi:hypothetical protein